MLEAKIDFLRSSSTFSAVTAARLRLLAEKLVLKSAKKNEVLVREGDQGDSCYLIQSGQVEVLQQQGEEEKSVALLGPGSLFGEASLLTQSPRNATVRAVEPTELLELKREDFLQVLIENRQLSHQVFELMTLRDRPQRKIGIEEHPDKTAEGIQITLLKNPQQGTYFRLSPEGLFIWRKLDGKSHLKDLTLLYLEKFKQFAPYAIAETISGLVASGFVESQSSRARFLLAATGWKKILAWALQALEWRWMLRDVDEKLSCFYQQAIHHLFGKAAQILFAVIAFGGILSFVTSLPWQSRFGEVGPVTWTLVGIALILSIIFHEAGHAFTTKAFGRKVLGLGIGWNWISPIFFVDTSDMWLATRRERILVCLAGPYVNLILAGIAALFIALVRTPSLQNGLWLFSCCSYIMVLAQLLPILKYDGHYALMEILKN